MKKLLTPVFLLSFLLSCMPVSLYASDESLPETEEVATKNLTVFTRNFMGVVKCRYVMQDGTLQVLYLRKKSNKTAEGWFYRDQEKILIKNAWALYAQLVMKKKTSQSNATRKEVFLPFFPGFNIITIYHDGSIGCNFAFTLESNKKTIHFALGETANGDPVGQAHEYEEATLSRKKHKQAVLLYNAPELWLKLKEKEKELCGKKSKSERLKKPYKKSGIILTNTEEKDCYTQYTCSMHPGEKPMTLRTLFILKTNDQLEGYVEETVTGEKTGLKKIPIYNNQDFLKKILKEARKNAEKERPAKRKRKDKE